MKCSDVSAVSGQCSQHSEVKLSLLFAQNLKYARELCPVRPQVSPLSKVLVKPGEVISVPCKGILQLSCKTLVFS